MFDNQKYISKGVSREIPVYIQNFLWYLIEILDSQNPDPFQVFKLYSEEGRQKVVHVGNGIAGNQEYAFDVSEFVVAKIIIIDTKNFTTMILAEEY